MVIKIKLKLMKVILLINSLCKSLNNIKALKFFENVTGGILDGNKFNSKIINIDITKKTTGEIFAGVGTGADGSNFSFGIKENNYLEEVSDINLCVSQES